MKKIFGKIVALAALALGGCTEDPNLVFEHEKPQFEIDPAAILVEVVLPTSSTDADSYYIIGDFNGGKDAAVGDLTWQLTKAESGVGKWGIYLNPATFVGGKTLADGFYFHSVAQGDERSAKNEEVSHTLDVGVGSRSTVWVAQWETYFNPPVIKEYYTIYAQVPDTWEAVALYMWYSDADGAEQNPLGGWPGGVISGQKKFGDRVFNYWKLDKSLNNVAVNFIFNNNNGGKQTANIEGMTLNRDYFYHVTDDAGNFEQVDEASLGEGVEIDQYKGYRVWVDNQTGWDDIALYGMGADYTSLTGAWPGVQKGGEKVVNGVTYTEFQIPAEANGKAIEFVFNNNKPASDAGLLKINGPAGYVHNAEVYMVVTAESATIATMGVERYIYVEDNTGWERLNVYYWGSGSDPAWPGYEPVREENIGGTNYKVFVAPAEHDGKTINLIFNNKVAGDDSGSQYDVAAAVLDKNYYFTATADGATQKAFTIYVNDQTGWGSFNVYVWGGGEMFGGWPGAASGGTKVIDGVSYKTFAVPAEYTGMTANIIFNGDGQYDVAQVVINRDFYITAQSGGVVTTSKVFVDNQSGWSPLYLYSWGGDPNYEPFGGWPGGSATTATIGVVTYSVFTTADDALGKTMNLIFNNNASQFNGPTVIALGDFYYRITDSKATAVTP